MKLSLAQATRFKEESQARQLAIDELLSILSYEKPVVPQIKLASALYKRYFSSGYTPVEAENVILTLLEGWAQNQKE